MKKKTAEQNLLAWMKNRNRIARFSDVLKAGYHPDTLRKLVMEGRVTRVARGLYMSADQESISQPDLVLAAAQAPRGVVCLISALYFHEMTAEIPGQVDLAIPAGTRANKIEFPPVRFYRYARPAWEAGADTHRIDGQTVKVYSPAKTVADCFKFRSRVGMDTARRALINAVRSRKAEPLEILRYARICRVTATVQPVLEAVI